jgi:hypothetical protein
MLMLGINIGSVCFGKPNFLAFARKGAKALIRNRIDALHIEKLVEVTLICLK